MKQTAIKTLFLDIGGVLLTNAWGRSSRVLAAKTFDLDIDEMNERHHLCFDTYEMGKLSMDDYLEQVVFYKKRNFTSSDFKSFIYTQSKALPKSIDFFTEIKGKYGLKVFSINNEAKEMNEYRISHFHLDKLFDAFISSCYVGLRKPDRDIFRFACNIAQAKPKEAIMIDDREMFVEAAKSVGLNAILFDNIDTVRNKLEIMLGGVVADQVR